MSWPNLKPITEFKTLTMLVVILFYYGLTSFATWKSLIIKALCECMSAIFYPAAL